MALFGITAEVWGGLEDHQDVLCWGWGCGLHGDALPHRERGGLDVGDRALHEGEHEDHHQGFSQRLQRGMCHIFSTVESFWGLITTEILSKSIRDYIYNT